MNELLKNINKILGSFDGSKLTVSFYSDGSIAFYIYEQEVPIIVDKEDKVVYFDASLSSDRLTGDMLGELSAIMSLIDENIDEVLSCY